MCWIPMLAFGWTQIRIREARFNAFFFGATETLTLDPLCFTPRQSFSKTWFEVMYSHGEAVAPLIQPVLELFGVDAATEEVKKARLTIAVLVFAEIISLF